MRSGVFRDYESAVMNFDFGTLVVAFIVSGLGFVLFSYGKRMQRMPQVVAGLVLLVGPYFTGSIIGSLLLTLGVGVLLYAALWFGL